MGDAGSDLARLPAPGADSGSRPGRWPGSCSTRRRTEAPRQRLLDGPAAAPGGPVPDHERLARKVPEVPERMPEGPSATHIVLSEAAPAGN